MIKEIWEDIPGYEGLYKVSSTGKIWGLKSNKILKPKTSKAGYFEVSLSKNGKMKTYILHRIVAQVFVPNPDNKETVNHIDENKKNNNFDNLEWLSIKENNCYGSRSKKEYFILAQKTRKPCYQYDLDGNLINSFPSQSQAAKETGLSLSSISNCMRGKTSQVHGYVFRGELL